MKKERRLLGFALCFVMLILLVSMMSVLVSANIEVCGDKQFQTTEPVSVRSLAQLCSNQPKGEDVSLYIVHDKDSVSLDIIKIEEISNDKFSCKSVWPVEETVAGEYDIFIDCIENSAYDTLEPFDSFTVTAVKGEGSVLRGEKDPGVHTWRYDSEEPELTNEMMQLKLNGQGEDIGLEKITITAFGTGDDSLLGKIEVYVDENGNGKVDTGEELIGDIEPAYSEDNGQTEVLVFYTLEKNLPTNLLIVYEMSDSVTEGEFSLRIDSVSGKGVTSDETIEFSGLPLTSSTKTVLPEKSCLGQLTLELEPNPVNAGKTVIARITGFAETGCEGKKIVLRPNPCGSSLLAEIGNCVVGVLALGEGETEQGCEVSFTASVSGTYHACIDKNEDGDMVDFGEYDFEDLVIEEEETEELEEGEEEVSEEEWAIGEGVEVGNVTEEGEQEIETITGSVIEELRQRISETSSLFVLLEITLLLILLVVVMILFKLRSVPGTGAGGAEAKEE